MFLYAMLLSFRADSAHFPYDAGGEKPDKLGVYQLAQDYIPQSMAGKVRQSFLSGLCAEEPAPLFLLPFRKQTAHLPMADAKEAAEAHMNIAESTLLLPSR